MRCLILAALVVPLLGACYSESSPAPTPADTPILSSTEVLELVKASLWPQLQMTRGLVTAWCRPSYSGHNEWRVLCEGPGLGGSLERPQWECTFIVLEHSRRVLPESDCRIPPW